MKRSALRAFTATSTGLCLLMLDLAAPTRATPATHSPAYVAIDVGTFGGPHAELNGPAVQITSQGAVLGTADTTVADTDYPNVNPFFGDPNPFLEHGFVWQRGQLTDLGALPGNNSSGVFEVNGSGAGAGISETGALDPLTGYPAEHAVLFEDGTVIDLGTLPGGTESQALAINDLGQVAGFADDGVPDSMSMLPFATQTRSFIWQDGAMRDLGTLGGPDAAAATLNARGQVAGDSYTNDTPNPTTGVPTTHPFLWTNGHMQDLGSLGGTQSLTGWLNSRGEVVGMSNLAGDQAFHPFLWDGRRLHDLGTFGGHFGIANRISDAGHVVGWATTTNDSSAHAFAWKDGVLTDLTGTGSAQCTFAEWVNEHDEAVGGTCDGSNEALLWAGGRQYDLSTLVAPSNARFTEASFINDQGEIAAIGVLPNGDQHVFLLRPAPGQPGQRPDVVPHPLNDGTQRTCGEWLQRHVVSRLASLRAPMPFGVTQC